MFHVIVHFTVHTADIIDMNGDFIDTYLSVFMELTSAAMTVEVFLAGISVKRYRKKLKEGKLSAG